MPVKLLQLALIFWLIGKWAFALDEIFDLYSSPQALAMGNALTSDASGHSALYYNPAGLSKATAKQWELTPIAVDTILSANGIAYTYNARSFGIYQIARELKKHPGKYAYQRLSFLPAIAKRNFGATLLASYQFAGRSDGTNLDTHTTFDVGPVFGASTNLAGNLLKVGATAKVLFRTEMNGIFSHDDIGTDESFRSKMSEGIGAGFDIGVLITLPARYLPSIGLVWKDMFNTYFMAPTRALNPHASGKPAPIEQAFNAAFSVKPALGKRTFGTFTIEMKHLERQSLSVLKRLHLGFQIEDERSFYLWIGLNQLILPTFGFAVRMPGGNLEVGTYAQDVGQGNNFEGDRRFFVRYTIGF